MYTDGSSLLADRSGGWAWWVDDDLCNSGYVCPATNNTMEITAVLQGLTALMWGPPLTESVEVVSDSAYVINCMKERWYDRWMTRGWRTSTNGEVANVDLWKELIEVVREFPAPLIWTHVRGHGRGGQEDAPHVAGNDVVDRLAGAARKAGIAGDDVVASRRRVLLGGPAPKRKRRIKLEDLQGLTFVVEGGHRYTAMDIEKGGLVLLLEESK